MVRGGRGKGVQVPDPLWNQKVEIRRRKGKINWILMKPRPPRFNVKTDREEEEDEEGTIQHISDG